MKEHDRPDLSDGAMALLGIAVENDRRGALARNATLMVALELGTRLLATCRAGDSAAEAITAAVGLGDPPPHFLALVAAALRRVVSDVERQRQDPRLGWAPPVSDFDRHVLQGFAEALADMAWPERDASDFNGPSLEECCEAFARHDARSLSLNTLQNYLGNVLQDYFAAARIREQVRDLEPDTEHNLRVRDGHAVAADAVLRAEEMTDEDGVPRLLRALEATINAVMAENGR